MLIPLYIGVRLAVERQETNLDLLYVTTLSPGRIIRGKLLCGVYLTILFFSACMPFMVLTNLLRGVDMPTIALALGLIFACTCGAVQLAIFLACLPVSNQFKTFLALPALGSMGMLISGIGLMSRDFMRSGLLGGPDFWGPTLVVAAIYLLVFGAVHLCSIALISPRAMNRSLPIRLYLTLVWLLSGLLAAYSPLMYSGVGYWAPFLHLWVIWGLGLLIVALVVTVSQPDELSMRVRRAIPRSRWKWLLAFFFYNGAAQGFAWIWGMVLVTAVGFWGFFNFSAPRGAAGPLLTLTDADVAFCLYAHAYALTGLFLHRTFFAHRTPVLASLFTFAIPALWSLLPCLVLFVLDRLTWDALKMPQLGNAFNLLLGDGSAITSHLWFAAGWSILAVIVNLPWFIRQVRAFKPPERTGNQPTP